MIVNMKLTSFSENNSILLPVTSSCAGATDHVTTPILHFAKELLSVENYSCVYNFHKKTIKYFL